MRLVDCVKSVKLILDFGVCKHVMVGLAESGHSEDAAHLVGRPSEPGHFPLQGGLYFGVDLQLDVDERLI